MEEYAGSLNKIKKKVGKKKQGAEEKEEEKRNNFARYRRLVQCPPRLVRRASSWDYLFYLSCVNISSSSPSPFPFLSSFPIQTKVI